MNCKKMILTSMCLISAVGSAFSQTPPGSYWLYPGTISSATWPASVPPASSAKPGYVLVWEDDFTYPSGATTNLDAKWNRETGCSQWNTYYGEMGTMLNEDVSGMGSSGIKGWELESDPSSSGNTLLNMRAIRQARPPGLICDHNVNGLDDLMPDGSVRPYTTTGMTSKRPFKYGYVEIRAKMPMGGGTGSTAGSFLPAFWFFRNPYFDREGYGLETDMLEMWSHCPRTWLTNSIAYDLPCYDPAFYPYEPTPNGSTWITGQSKSTIIGATDPATFSNRFWTYGMEWDNAQLYFYLNGVCVRKIRNDCNIARCFSDLIINIAAKNQYVPGDCGKGTTTILAEMEIDYVRIYKRILLDNFGSDASVGGWDGTKHTRLMGDADGDGRDDLIGYGESQVFVARAAETTRGFGFLPATSLFSNMCFAQGWTKDKYPVTAGDVNGDGKIDLVGFGGAGVFVARATGTPGTVSYTAPYLTVNNFGYDASAGGWRVGNHPRMLADVNGDGKADVVGFGGAGVYVSLGSGTTTSANFGAATLWSTEFGYDIAAGTWRETQHRRMMKDMNGDGKADVVGFYNSEVRVALANSSGTGFLPSTVWLNDLGYTHGYHNPACLIDLADITGDGKADVIAGNLSGQVYTARNTGSSLTAKALQFTLPMGISYAVDKPLIGDMTGDGKADVLFFGAYANLAQSIGTPTSAALSAPRPWLDALGSSSADGPYTANVHTRLIGDVNNDGVMDVFGCAAKGVFGHESPACTSWDPSNGQKPCVIAYNFANCTWVDDPACEEEPCGGGVPCKTSQVPVDIEKEVQVFPNPNQGAFTVAHGDAPLGGLPYQLIDQSGKVVIAGHTMADGKIEVKGLPPGVYFIRGVDGGKPFHQKVVITR